jgi:hypothetical protein
MPLWVELPRPDAIKVDCHELLLGKNFLIPNSFIEFIEGKNHANNHGNSGKTNKNSDPSANAESLVNQQLPGLSTSQTTWGELAQSARGTIGLKLFVKTSKSGIATAERWTLLLFIL